MNNCIEFSGPKTKFGYGKQKFKGKQTSAHRVAYQKAYGEIPKGLCVLHKCDNPSCINPEHLFLGTHKDNTKDMFTKNRANKAKGVTNGTSKLTEAEVLQIRNSIEKYSILSKKFNVSKALICLVKQRKLWKHI